MNPMTPEHKTNLSINTAVMKENLEVKHILGPLLQCEILNQCEVDGIRGSKNGVEQFLYHLTKKNDEAYLKFIDILKKTGEKNGLLASRLELTARGQIGIKLLN